MEYAGKLISVGLNPSEIYQKCYESNSKDMVLFQSYCVNKANFLNNDKIAYTIVYKKIWKNIIITAKILRMV